MTAKKINASDNHFTEIFLKIESNNKQDISSILRMTLDSAQSVLSKYYIQNHKADIVIEISRESCSFYEFTKAYEMIEIGKLSTKEVLK